MCDASAKPRLAGQITRHAAGAHVVAVGALHLYGEGNLPQMLAKKMANIAIGPSKRNFIFLFYAVTLSDGVTRLSLNLTILQYS